MSAWLEVEVESCPASSFSSLFERKNLSMLQSLVGVTACADDGTRCVHNNRAYAWIGRCQTDALTSQIYGSTQKLFVNVAIGHFAFCTTESQRKNTGTRKPCLWLCASVVAKLCEQ